MKHFLEIDGISLNFGNKRVLQDIFFSNETGKLTGLLGRNGSGKTCLLNIVYGSLKVNDKSVRLDGETIFGGFRKPQNFRYLPQFSFIPKNLSISRVFKDYELDFSRFCNFFPEFKKYYKSKLKKLSSGEQRIIEIYIILVSKTKFCMLDEPFSQVMPIYIEILKKIINTEKENKGIIITDQAYQHVITICDDLYVILNGKTFLVKNIEDLVTYGYITKPI